MIIKYGGPYIASARGQVKTNPCRPLRKFFILAELKTSALIAGNLRFHQSPFLQLSGSGSAQQCSEPTQAISPQAKKPMTTMKTDTLFAIGETSLDVNQWPNYLEHGFDEQDVPALLALVADQSLLAATGDSKEVWVPLHAWRTIGQLGSESAIEPLIALFDALVDDDWAIHELPSVMGMIGRPALEPLARYLNEVDHDEFARVMAAESLREIAQHHPELRGEVLEHYKHYITHADTTAHAVNGLLITCLLDLGATELIDDIRGLFARQCVDILCAGDLEDVEMALGLRLERSTPRPDLLEQFDFNIGAQSRPDSDDIIELIDYFLTYYGSDESILGASELDGYFVACACAPHIIASSLWMPVLWGGEEFKPAWETEEDFREFNEIVMTFYNYVMEGMNNNMHDAIFLIQEIDQHSYTIVDEWCVGFLRAINLWGPLSPADTLALEEALKPIQLFATESGLEHLNSLSEKEIEEHQQSIEPAVQKLFKHFFSRREQPGQPRVRSAEKITRNDLCPCGSGKKYKKCCLH